jgi:putative oxidoreductase
VKSSAKCPSRPNPAADRIEAAMFDRFHPHLLLLARLLLSPIFLFSGVMKITDWSGTAAHMTEEGMPLAPVLLAGAIAIEVGAGLGVLLGCGTRWSALALIVFLVPATLVFHDF